MEKDKELEQLIGDLNKIMGFFTKLENSSLDDVEALKEESTLLQKELKERYDESNTGETDPQEA
jgi:Asp-tRNA(Asn)/Glu-tRNA(Gln) amidotransferase C subunit